MSTPIGRQAVVVGAGIGGLTAAAALADHFERVVVLERDALAREAAHRAGTPQAKHVHALLAGGQHALGDLLPGFEQDLARAGAVPLGVGLDVRVERPSYDPFPQRDLGWLGYSRRRASTRWRPTCGAMVRPTARTAARGRPGWGGAKPRSVYRDPELVQRVRSDLPGQGCSHDPHYGLSSAALPRARSPGGRGCPSSSGQMGGAIAPRT
jgi:choline dehydrogenase-like flavoprotein